LPEAVPHVLFVIPQLDPGGSEVQLVELVERTHPARLRASVAVLRTTRDRRLIERLRTAGVEPRVPPPFGSSRLLADAQGVGRIEALIRRLRPDVVYAWLEQAAVVSVPAARLHGTPALVARRNVCGAAVERFAPVRLAIRQAERRAALVTGNSRAVVDEAVRRGIDPGRLRLIENGHAPAPAVQMPADAMVALGYVAHFRNEKGHLRLLDTLARVQAATPWRIDLAGRGALAERVRARAAELGLDGHVTLIGPIDDSRAFWEDHAVAVLLSDFEGSPNALIEAAMAGRPMVATDSGGTRDVVAPGTGFLVRVDEPARGAEALARLIDDRALRERMGAAAHDHVVERFSVERFVEGHLAAITEVLARRAGD
jgi:glycosyltransferase involved in cell wall biosynthesis